MQNEPIEVTLKVTGVFEELGIPYLIGGSLASTLYGMVRTTQDADIVAEMRLEWYRMGGEVSERQWRDILGILKTRSGELDLAYLEQWAKELAVEELLKRVLSEA